MFSSPDRECAQGEAHETREELRVIHDRCSIHVGRLMKKTRGWSGGKRPATAFVDLLNPFFNLSELQKSSRLLTCADLSREIDRRSGFQVYI